MVYFGEQLCPVCGGKLKHYDKVKRIIRTKYRRSKWLTIQRLKCGRCGRIHRELPDSIYIYKQYEADVIEGVVEGLITSDTLGFEDYPCEKTMQNWIKMNTTVKHDSG